MPPHWPSCCCERRQDRVAVSPGQTEALLFAADRAFLPCALPVTVTSICTQAAVVVDQNTKLSVFATRPAIYAPFFNWITEFVGTAFKVAGVQGIYLQVRGHLFSWTGPPL